MVKRSDIVFVCVVAVFLSGVLLSLALSPAPQNASALKSVLEGREYTQLPTAGRESMLAQGELQDLIEKYLSDMVPYRDDVILTNASLQRVEIQLANLLFRRAAYPAYFNSDRVVSSTTGAIYRMPAKVDAYSSEMTLSTADRVAGLARTRSDIKWAFYLVDNTDISSANPAHLLVSDPLAYGDLFDMLKGVLEDSNVSVIDGSYESEGDYLECFFRTDHHMQVQGGVRMYESIMAAFQRDPLKFDKYRVACADKFYGSDARAGLYTDDADVVWDVVYEPSELSVSIDGAMKDSSSLDRSWSRDGTYRKSSRFANVYAEYFHTDYRIVAIENQGLDESAGSLLLISDSYDNSTSRLYAESYKRVYEVSCKSGLDIGAFIADHPDINDAAFIVSPDYLDDLLVVK